MNKGSITDFEPGSIYFPCSNCNINFQVDYSFDRKTKANPVKESEINDFMRYIGWAKEIITYDIKINAPSYSISMPFTKHYSEPFYQNQKLLPYMELYMKNLTSFSDNLYNHVNQSYWSLFFNYMKDFPVNKFQKSDYNALVYGFFKVLCHYDMNISLNGAWVFAELKYRSHEKQLCKSCYSDHIKMQNAIPKSGKRCPSCGKTMDDDINFCPDCGKQTRYVKYCHNCKVTVETKYCPKCGEQIIL